MSFYPLFLPSLGTTEIFVVFIVILILFGPGKLPDVFKALGQGVRQFKDASKTVKEEAQAALSPDPSDKHAA